VIPGYIKKKLKQLNNTYIIIGKEIKEETSNEDEEKLLENIKTTFQKDENIIKLTKDVE